MRAKGPSRREEERSGRSSQQTGAAESPGAESPGVLVRIWHFILSVMGNHWRTERGGIGLKFPDAVWRGIGPGGGQLVFVEIRKGERWRCSSGDEQWRLLPAGFTDGFHVGCEREKSKLPPKFLVCSTEWTAVPFTGMDWRGKKSILLILSKQDIKQQGTFSLHKNSVNQWHLSKDSPFPFVKII